MSTHDMGRIPEGENRGITDLESLLWKEILVIKKYYLITDFFKEFKKLLHSHFEFNKATW